MYTSFEMRNFRCFPELTLSHLNRINLVTGVNNVGKTALLEGLFLHCGAYNPELTLRINAFRGVDSIKVERGKGAETPWDSLFTGFDVSKEIVLVGSELSSGNGAVRRRSVSLSVIRDQDQVSTILVPLESTADESGKLLLTTKSAPQSSSSVDIVLKLEHREEKDRVGEYYMIVDAKGLHTTPLPPPPPFPAFFLTPRSRIPLQEGAERLGRLEIAGEQDIVVKGLRVIEPNLRRLTVVVTGGTPVIHADLGMGRLVPLPFVGEGMMRIADLVLAIGNARGGVVLVDEIENGLHYSALYKLWQVLADVSSQFNTQIFATTHSRECIEAAHRAFADRRTYEFALHRLERFHTGVRVVTYDQESIEGALETGLEVR